MRRTYKIVAIIVVLIVVAALTLWGTASLLYANNKEVNRINRVALTCNSDVMLLGDKVVLQGELLDPRPFVPIMRQCVQRVCDNKFFVCLNKQRTEFLRNNIGCYGVALYQWHDTTNAAFFLKASLSFGFDDYFERYLSYSSALPNDLTCLHFDKMDDMLVQLKTYCNAYVAGDTNQMAIILADATWNRDRFWPHPFQERFAFESFLLRSGRKKLSPGLMNEYCLKDETFMRQRMQSAIVDDFPLLFVDELGELYLIAESLDADSQRVGQWSQKLDDLLASLNKAGKTNFAVRVATLRQEERKARETP